MNYDSTEDTMNHIRKVRFNMFQIEDSLYIRSTVHDQSKLESPEKEVYDKITPLLKELEYGSEEYRATLREMKDGIDHHYKHNSHHPEHYNNGVLDMSLLDILEMLSDWKAATERVNGDFESGLHYNKDRFNISDELFNYLYKTSKELGWI